MIFTIKQIRCATADWTTQLSIWGLFIWKNHLCILIGTGDIDVQSWSLVYSVSHRRSIYAIYKYVCMCVCVCVLVCVKLNHLTLMELNCVRLFLTGALSHMYLLRANLSSHTATTLNSQWRCLGGPVPSRLAAVLDMERFHPHTTLSPNCRCVGMEKSAGSDEERLSLGMIQGMLKDFTKYEQYLHTVCLALTIGFSHITPANFNRSGYNFTGICRRKVKSQRVKILVP